MEAVATQRDSRSWNRILLIAFGVLMATGSLIGAVAALVGGDTRELVVTMQQGITQADRQTLKDDCGALPGISVVPDQGAADKQYRFPVRFQIGNTTTSQEAALEACINDHHNLVRGVLTGG